MPASGIKVGTFNAGASAVTGVGFRPSALWLYTVNATANGYGNSGAGAYAMCAGFAISNGTKGYVSYWYDGGLGTQDAWNDTTFALVFPNDNLVNGRGTMNIASWDADGFSLTYPTSPSSAFIVGYVAFSGVQAYLLSALWGNPSQSYTGFGFKPDLVQVWDSGCGNPTGQRRTGGSPAVSRIQNAMFGRNILGTSLRGLRMSQIYSSIVGTLFPSATSTEGTNDFGFAGSWGILVPNNWNFTTATMDTDGFSWASTTTDPGPFGMIGMGMKGTGLAVEIAEVDMDNTTNDVVITLTDVVNPKLFVVQCRQPGVILASAGTTQTGYGFYDGANQFVFHKSFSEYALWDDRYCGGWDLSGIGSANFIYGSGGISNGTVTLKKVGATNTGQKIQYAAIGLSTSFVPGIYRWTR